MAFTPEEQATIDRLKLEGKSADEIAAYIGGARLGSPSTLQQREISQEMVEMKKTVQPEPAGMSLLETGSDVVDTVSNLGERWSRQQEFSRERAQAVTQAAVREEGEGFWENIGQTFGQAGRSGLQIGGETMGAAADTLGELFIGTGKLFLTDEQEQNIANDFASLVSPIAESETVQNMVADYQWLEENNPQKAADVRASLGAINFLSEFVGVGVTKPVVGSVAAGARETGRQVTKRGVRAVVTPTPATVTPTRTPTPSGRAGLTETAASRLKENIQNSADTIRRAVQDERIRTERLKNSIPEAADAERAGVPVKVVNQYTTADGATKPVYRELVEAYNSGNAEEAVPGIFSRLADAQYKTVTNKLDDLGRQYEEAFESLPGGAVNMRPAVESVQNTLRQAGARFDDSGNLVDAGRSFTPDEAEWVKKLYDTVYKYGDDVTYQDLRTGDQVLSRINREAYAKDVTPPRIGDENLSTIMRDAIRSELDEVLPTYRQLNNEYRETINFKDALDKTIFDTGRKLEGVEINASEATETNLRRLFSNAKSKTQYKAVTRALDDFAREQGYEGAKLEDVARFNLEVQNLYPDEIPKASLGGSIKGVIGSLIGGQTDPRQTQEALAKLVGAGQKTGAVKNVSTVALGGLAAYYSMGDDGELLPSAGLAAAMGTTQGRRLVAKELDTFITRQVKARDELLKKGLKETHPSVKAIDKSIDAATKEKNRVIGQ